MNKTEPATSYTADSQSAPYIIRYIVSGTPQEYEAWLRRRGLDRRAYRYVNCPSMFTGMKNITGFFIGTYLNRPDIEDIQKRIRISKINFDNIGISN